MTALQNKNTTGAMMQLNLLNQSLSTLSTGVGGMATPGVNPGLGPSTVKPGLGPSTVKPGPGPPAGIAYFSIILNSWKILYYYFL
jgi:hypothetical protein